MVFGFERKQKAGEQDIRVGMVCDLPEPEPFRGYGLPRKRLYCRFLRLEILGDVLVRMAVAVHFKESVELDSGFATVRKLGENGTEERGVVLKVGQRQVVCAVSVGVVDGLEQFEHGVKPVPVRDLESVRSVEVQQECCRAEPVMPSGEFSLPEGKRLFWVVCGGLRELGPRLDDLQDGFAVGEGEVLALPASKVPAECLLECLSRHVLRIAENSPPLFQRFGGYLA